MLLFVSVVVIVFACIVSVLSSRLARILAAMPGAYVSLLMGLGGDEEPSEHSEEDLEEQPEEPPKRGQQEGRQEEPSKRRRITQAAAERSIPQKFDATKNFVEPRRAACSIGPAARFPRSGGGDLRTPSFEPDPFDEILGPSLAGKRSKTCLN